MLDFKDFVNFGHFFAYTENRYSFSTNQASN